MDQLQSTSLAPTSSPRPAWMTPEYLAQVEKYKQEFPGTYECGCKTCHNKLPATTVEPIKTELAATLQQAQEAPATTLPAAPPETSQAQNTVAASSEPVAPRPLANDTIRLQQQEVETYLADLETPDVPFESIVRRMRDAHDDVIRQMADSLFESGDPINESLRQDFLNDLAAYWVYLQSLLD